MKNLSQEVKASFEEGQFIYRQKPGCFNGIWSDMCVEKTVIKDSKSDSGIIGLTRKKSALVRWTLTRHIMGEYTTTMKYRSRLLHSDQDTAHLETMSSGIKRDEKHVRDLVCHMENNMTNPFDVESHPEVL
jgi:hypothetical protein